MSLTINMRVLAASSAEEGAAVQEFADFLLQIGEGRHVTGVDLEPEFALIAKDLLLRPPTDGTSSLNELIQSTFPDVREGYTLENYFSNRAILSPRNAYVRHVNDLIMDMIPEDEHVYLSIDSVHNQEEHQELMLPVEFLNTLNISGVPAHQLKLKRGVPILLMRNINAEEGLCNGTRLRVENLTRNCIHAKILTGTRRGHDVLIPRITNISQDSTLPFQIRRRQFPVQIAFAMSINKAQGQTVSHLGLYLPQSVFAHGQLYVGLSRVTSRATIKVLIEDPAFEDERGAFTKNVVYKDVLRLRQ
jgi:ATP-dependent DNA helicase PIF1